MFRSKTLFLFILNFFSSEIFSQNNVYVATLVNPNINNVSSELYIVNTSNCTSSRIAKNVDFYVLYDIAFNPVDGHLYVIYASGTAYAPIDLKKEAYIPNEYGSVPAQVDEENYRALNIFNSYYFNAFTYDSEGVAYFASEYSLLSKKNNTSKYKILGEIPKNFGQSAGDLTFVNGELYLATLTGNIVKIDTADLSKSVVITNTGLEKSYGVSSNCKDSLFVYDDNDVYVINVNNPGKPRLVCENIVPGQITGASTALENEVDVKILGEDFICPNVTTDTLFVNSYFSELQWSTGVTSNKAVISDTGTYWVKQKNICGESMDSIHIGLGKLPDITSLDTTAPCFPASMNLDNDKYTFESLVPDEGENIIFPEVGEFLVKVNDGFCSNNIPVTITQVGNNFNYPNVITPNGDDKNETFEIEKYISNPIELEIYNRWGKLIFRSDDYQNDWKEATTGVYFYSSKIGDCKANGWIQVIE